MNTPPPSYPSYIQFSSPTQTQTALQLLPYTRAFFEGGILDDQEDTGWSNVLAHCLLEAQAVGVLATHLPHLGNKEDLQVAAFLHDAYKRREIEALKDNPADMTLLYTTDNESKDWLKSLGYPEEILSLQQAYGNNAALRIFRGEITDLTLRTLHYIDDITKGDELVSLEERLSALEQNSHYTEQNEWSRRFFDGHTLYEAKRIINKATEQELAKQLHLETPEHLPLWIKTQLD